MNKVRLKDIADVISEREENPAKSSYTKFVGLEHYDSGCLEIIRCGETNNLTSAMKIFKTGDTLVARRNVYLRRAGFVNFDGLTSGDSIVIRAKDKEHERLIPIILNTEHFWSYAVKHAAGSMSKRLQQNDLMDYEFELPSIEKQKELIDILWAAEELKLKYRKLENLKDILIKQIIFDNLNEKNTCLLGDIVELNYGRSQKNLDSEGPYPIFGTSGILGYTNKFLYERESIIIGRKGTINKPIYVNEPFWAVDTTFYIQKKTNFNIKWLFYYLFYLVDFLSLNQATGVPSLSSNIVKNIKIPLPSIEIQNEIVSICFSIEDVFEKAKNNIDLIDRIIKKIINGGQVNVQ